MVPSVSDSNGDFPLWGTVLPTDELPGNVAGGGDGARPMYTHFVSREVEHCFRLQRLIHNRQEILNSVKRFRNIGVGVTLGAAAFGLWSALPILETKNIVSPTVNFANFIAMGSVAFAGLSLARRGTLELISAFFSLRAAQDQFAAQNCKEVIRKEGERAAGEMESDHLVTARWISQELDLAVESLATTAMAGMEGRNTPPAPWRKAVAPGAVAAVATIVAAAAIAEDFFPIVGGPANDAPAVTAAVASWRLYLSCF